MRREVISLTQGIPTDSRARSVSKIDTVPRSSLA